jgi:hypothetical protein
MAPNFMFSLVPGIVTIGFIVFFIIFITIAIKGIAQWNRNNHSPVLTVTARVIAKRANVSHHTHHNANNVGMHHSTSTSYYVTFEFESGDRLELHVPHSEFGYLIEGDMGRLTFQGTRYKGFQRDIAFPEKS